MSEKNKCIICNKEGDSFIGKCLCGKVKVCCCGYCIAILNDDLEYLKGKYPDRMKEDCCKSLE